LSKGGRAVPDYGAPFAFASTVSFTLKYAGCCRITRDMGALSTSIICDGCGVPASAEHLATRLERLELATRFRPIHIQVLFVTLQPMLRQEDDFYRPPVSRDFFDSFLAALDIPAGKANSHPEADRAESDTARLLEFQRRGYYLTYLSECPAPPPHPADANGVRDSAVESISRLGPTLVKRIRFNYKPKYVALLGTSLSLLLEVFAEAGLAPLLLLDNGRPLALPEPGDAASLALFRKALIVETPQAKSSSGV
jgi:hypothetical protein